MLQPVIQQLSNYFLNPLGVAALLGLVPLIIFYLMRPSPEEKVMPSMKFFQQDKKSGRLQKALKVLQRNVMLILHILMVIGLTAAIANPYIMGEQRPENAVIVIDNSASMKPVFDQVKQEAASQVGHSNTVILSNDETEVVMEKASASETRNLIRSVEVEETGTDIVRAVQRAQNYEGKLFLATDFQQTTETDTEIENLLKTVSASRPLETFNPAKNNDWGIVDLQIGKENGTAFIQNYRQENSSIGLEIGPDKRNLNLGPGELRQLSFSLAEGRNTLSLEQDGFEVDNNAYVFRPPSQQTEVAVIDDQRNRYLMKALDIIENVEATHFNPSDTVPESDVYVLGRTGSLGEVDTQGIVSDVQQGKGLILYGQQGASDISSGIPVNSVGGPYNTTVDVSEPVDIETGIPVNSVGGPYNTTVDVSEPVDIETGNITIMDSDVDGESVSRPEEALKFADIGEGEFVYFNFGSKEFRESLDYPVFWKQIIERADGKSSMQELNRETGTTVLTEDETLELTDTGFTDIDGATYASNLLNGEESRFETFRAKEYSSAETVQQPQSLKAIPVVILMILGLAEMTYLYRRGEIP